MSASDIRAGRAYVEVYSRDNTAPGLTAIRNRLTAFAGTVRAIGGVALGVAGMGAAAVIKAARIGSDIQDAADRTGLTAEAVQELGFAAGQAGASVEALETGIKMMQKNLATASDSTVESLASVGLSIDDLRRMSPDKQFEALAGALAKVEDPALRTKLAMEFFGRSGADLIPMLRLGSEGIAKLRQEARDAGAVLSAADVAKLEAFGDQLDVLSKQFSVMVAKVGIELLPIAKEFVETLGEMAVAMGKAKEGAREWLLDQFGIAGWWRMVGAGAPVPQNAAIQKVDEAAAAAVAEVMPDKVIHGFGASTLDAVGSSNLAKDQLEVQKDMRKELVALNKKKPAALPGFAP